MSQAQRNGGLTPFSRNDFYDKTYLQKLRNDVKRLDNTNLNNSHHVKPAAALEQPLSPRPKGSSTPRNRVARPSDASAGYNSSLLHPNSYSSRSKSPRSLSRNGSSRSKSRHSTTPHKLLRSVSPCIRRSITPRRQPSKSPSPTRSPKVNSNTLGSNLILLPSIERSPSRVSTNRGKSMSREKSNLLLKASLQKRGSFPKIGMSELPSITITQKPVTPQNCGNGQLNGSTGALAPVEHGSRMSRRDQYLYNQMQQKPSHHSKAPHQGLSMVEVSVSPYSQGVFNRLVISPTVSTMSTADDLAALAIHGEKLTPQHSPRGSPLHSPNRYTHHSPYVSQHVSRARGHHYSNISQTNSPSRDVSPHHSPANSVYNGSPSHSPSRFFTSESRRASDLSNYSGDDVSLHKYINQSVVHHPGVVYATQTSPYTQTSHTPVSISMPLHRRASLPNKANSRNTSPNGPMYLDAQRSPTYSTIAPVRDMSTQTFNTQDKSRQKNKSPKKSERQNKKTQHQSNQSSSQKDLPSMLQREKSSVNLLNQNTAPSANDQPKRNKALLVMKTVTTVTPTTDTDPEPASYSRESTIHIDIDYDSNTSAEDILKSAVISHLPNAHISTVLVPGPQPNTDKMAAPVTPSHDRRSSVSGPIPEISLMCATPDELTPASPGIPKIDGEQHMITASD